MQRLWSLSEQLAIAPGRGPKAGHSKPALRNIKAGHTQRE